MAAIKMKPVGKVSVPDARLISGSIVFLLYMRYKDLVKIW
jgi:hypothetical protein